jgi:ATP-binding protein involved in chromosome partitioning
MALNIRTYHDLTEPDRSGLLGQVVAQRARVAERLAAVGRVVAVMSGKGGVGKSYVTAHLARALARRGAQAGVLDADLNGPTIGRLLEAAGPLVVDADGVHPRGGTDGVRCVSMAHLVEDGQPLAFKGPEAESFIWRGTLEASALRELLGDVAWGTLDTLLLDLPPGMQRFLELCDLLPAPPAVLTVTIPTPESGDAVRRAMRAAADRGAPLLGVIENMAGPPFTGSAGDDLSREFGVPLLARIPWHPAPDTWGQLAGRLG